MKKGIVVIAGIDGELGERIHRVQREFDPRLAAELPPHITIAGSSGMGPIAVDTPVAELESKLEPVARDTAPISLRFGTPNRFMQTTIVVLPIDPHGPIRALHEAIKTSGLRYEAPRFAFTPHCTLNFYRELPKALLQALLAERFDESFTIDRIGLYRSESLTRTKKVLELTLRGGA